MVQHRGARSRGTDDRVGSARLKDLDRAPRQRARLAPVAGVERRLAATGLPRVEVDRATDLPEHLDRAHRCGWPKLISKTSHEQRNFHDRPERVTTPFTYSGVSCSPPNAWGTWASAR